MSASVISGTGELLSILAMHRHERATLHLQIEDDGEQEHEDCNCQIHPLNILQRVSAVARVLEENVRAQDRGHDRTNAVERLREVDS